MMTESLVAIAERYRAAAAAFTDRVRGVQDWDAPTPVREWRARDVVDHLTTWLPGMLSAGSDVDLGPMPLAADDPVAAWATFDQRLQALLEDPGTATLLHRNPHTGENPVPAVVDVYFTPDVYFHLWDLARSSGQDDRLPAAFVTETYAGMKAMESLIRGSGQFGEQQPVPDDATEQERLFAFLGRDPRWTPSGD